MQRINGVNMSKTKAARQNAKHAERELEQFHIDHLRGQQQGQTWAPQLTGGEHYQEKLKWLSWRAGETRRVADALSEGSGFAWKDCESDQLFSPSRPLSLSLSVYIIYMHIYIYIYIYVHLKRDTNR